MLHWIALLPGHLAPCHEDHTDATAPEGIPLVLDATHLAWWALQFTPRVASLEDAVVLEVHASERLFGGAMMLRERIVNEAQAHGVLSWAHARTALAAVALARHPSGPLHDAAQAAERLDKLPLKTLTGVAAHEHTLSRLGCRTLADIRALPRGGLSRRFGANLVHALDQAYGLAPETFDWLTLPAVFDARLELPGRVESAPALLFAASRLLQQLCAWLAGRQAGVMAFTLKWLHAWHRRDEHKGDEWTVRLGSPTRDYTRLSRLLAEHLQRIQLIAPVSDISLHADEIEALPLSSQQLFQEHREDQLSAAPDALLTPAAQRAQRDALLALLEKLSVRMGPERVLQARVQADHRLECAQQWQAALEAQSMKPNMQGHAARQHLVADTPQPCWLLLEPLPLALDRTWGQHPLYQGQLTLLAGPHRIEAGWWDAGTQHDRVTRDYYLASSPQAGLLWIYKRQQAVDDTRSPWYLHGFFA